VADFPANISQYWPPQLPPFVEVEGTMGPRWGQTTTMFPAFPSLAGTSEPDLANPRLASLAGQGGSFGGQVRAALKIPLLAPSVGLDFTFRDNAKGPFTFTGGAENDAIRPTEAIPDVLPTRSLGMYGSILGLGAGYRNLAFASLPGLKGERSANLAVSTLGLGIGLGPVEAALTGLSGFGWVADTAGAVVIPGEAEAHLGLTVWGIKAKLGVRGEALAYGGDIPSLLNVLVPNRLLDFVFESKPDAKDTDKAKLVRDLARLSYTWGPYLQVGVAF